MITRRTMLKAALGAGAARLRSGALPPVMRQDDRGVTAQVRADLQRHASFGDKFSGGPGDMATAGWIAGRLRTPGYRVQAPEFEAPFFVKRSARFKTGTATVEVVPQAPVVATGAAGIAAPLALVENQVGDAKRGICRDGHSQLPADVPIRKWQSVGCQPGGLPLMKDFLNGRKRRPTHPGEALREDIMPAAGINQAQLARDLGVSRLTISEIVLEKRAVTPDIASRLAKYFGTSPDLWLGLQKDVDLWDAMQVNRKAYARFKGVRGGSRRVRRLSRVT